MLHIMVERIVTGLEHVGIQVNEGGYIVPAYIDGLDAYSDKITGYAAGKVGQPLSNFDFEHFAFVG